jgi:hypothetical protein
MRRLLTLLVKIAALFAGYIAAVLALRPWFTTWGATEEEIEKTLPGDEIMTRGASSVHAITIEAPRAEVWKWLVQIGQDRAGFYSYSALENLFRADIHNSDRIVPEWQSVQTGDFIRLASKERYGDFPLLRVMAVEKERHLVLERWGAFVLEEIDPSTTRLIIRSHGGNPLGGRLLNALFWEPAHFIMEYGMLHGIKRRAERAA